jgi:hypothetical protein
VQLFEHPQNFHLQRILSSNLLLAEQFRGEGAAGGVGRATQTWLDLQQNVSALLDSTQGKAAQGAPGIRQQLEKKEVRPGRRQGGGRGALKLFYLQTRRDAAVFVDLIRRCFLSTLFC